jgi:hypothetical protein
VHRGNWEGGQFESVRFEGLARGLEAVQRELVGKVNLKDVLPLVRQGSQPLGQAL